MLSFLSSNLIFFRAFQVIETFAETRSYANCIQFVHLSKFKKVLGLIGLRGLSYCVFVQVLFRNASRYSYSFIFYPLLHSNRQQI